MLHVLLLYLAALPCCLASLPCLVAITHCLGLLPLHATSPRYHCALLQNTF